MTLNPSCQLQVTNSPKLNILNWRLWTTLPTVPCWAYFLDRVHLWHHLRLWAACNHGTWDGWWSQRGPQSGFWWVQCFFKDWMSGSRVLVIINIIPIIRIIDDVMSSHAHSGVTWGHRFLLSTDSFTLLNSKIISEYWLSCDQSRLFDDWLVV